VSSSEVELLQQPLDAVLGADALLDQPQPGAHEVARTALGGRDHVGQRDQVGTQQQRQGVRVDLIGLDLGRGDRLHASRVGQDQLHAQASQRVSQPVPATGGFDDGPVRPGEFGEVPRHLE